DLKPSNVLCSWQGSKPVAKIIDFGIAKATGQQLTEKTMQTQQGQVVGTLEYMSPEQAQLTDSHVDTRTDIYSLGVLLYELLTGNTPLNRSSISKLGFVDILNRIKDEEPVKPSSRISESSLDLNEIAAVRGVEPTRLFVELRGDLDWIVLKALDKDPDRRYETAASLADDIEHYLNEEPIDARPPTRLYLATKFARRNRVAVMAGAVSLVVLMSGIVLTTAQWFRATRAEETVAEQFELLKESYRLEIENSRLMKDLDQKNLDAKAELSSEIELLIGFGRWGEALLKLDTFANTPDFGELPMELDFLRLSALDGLSQNAELQREIERLETRAEASSYLDQLNLWRGYAFLSGASDTDGKESLRLIRQAIESGNLSESDECFAKGLVNPSLTDALANYQKALALLPYHAQARMQLIVTMIVLGRDEDVLKQLAVAKSMFPGDARYQYAEFAANAFANKRVAMTLARTELAKNPDTPFLDELRALGRLSTAVNNQLRTYDRDGLRDWFGIMRQGLPLAQESSYRSIPVAGFQKQRLFSAYGQFAASFLNPLMRFASEKKKHALIIQNCQTAWDIHEDGIFKCFEAWSWFALEEYEKSAAAFAIATDSDSLFPANRIQGGYGAFLSLKMDFDRTGNRAQLKQAMNYLEAYSNERFESHRGQVMFEAAAEAGRWDLAQKITDEMIRRDGGIIFDWSIRLLNAAEGQANLGLALSVCDELLENAPNDISLQNRRRRIQAKIAADLKRDRVKANLR
ncbi:MAG: protein kinase, partial [Pirellulaceae bacterium]|nr:protein kinase [Pirellulaceae bacterium]